MELGSQPAMSVVVATPDCYETIEKTISHLRAQTVRDQLELIIVGPSAALADDHTVELACFRATRAVEVDEVRSLAEANAAGARRASSPVIAFIEGHAYPDPGWAEALITAHREPCAVVGPVVRNANPGSLISRVEMLIGYGPWMDPTPRGPVAHLPGHNSSYKRSVLLEYDDQLECLLAAECVLHWDLNARGHRLCLEPAAKISHLNSSLFASMVRERLHSGRFFAAFRATEWSSLRRLIYAGGAPLIPLVRFLRIVRQLRRSGSARRLPLAMVPLVLVGLGVSALGEGMGYAFGLGNSQEKGLDLQFHREQHINERDLELIQP